MNVLPTNNIFIPMRSSDEVILADTNLKLLLLYGYTLGTLGTLGVWIYSV